MNRRKALRLLFLLVALGFGAWSIAGQWGAVSEGFARLSWPELSVSLVAVLGALAAGMMMWRSLLAEFGSPLSLTSAAKIFFLGQLGKYIPGSAVHVMLAQMEMGRDHGIPRSRSAAAFFLTYPIYLATGLLVGVVTLPVIGGDSVARYAWLLLLVPVLAVALHPRIVNPVIGFGLRRLRRPPLERPLTRRGILTAVGWALAGWAAYGVHLAMIVHGLGARGADALILSFGAFALAWCLGTLAIVFPAGAGVREVAMVAALAPVLDRGSAIAAALCSRLIVSVGDLVCAALAGLASRRSVQPSGRPVEKH
ncbi:membrane protein [Planotetraspora thailandica]|uniref:Membrane protein n=1 Tax=Planotetraspora thailandica TaxID=487172 RepID=A0A8J3XV37_9ACTN|nr:lysylphosphatidylglycerol synthase transmembrane domain-containing protein [Planotetraspora thailandica]GII53286.1 membrane protein [Planotetraspora thailandica]